MARTVYEFCHVCDNNVATVRVVAADVNGTVLDSTFVCTDVECVRKASGLLACGLQTVPFVKES